MPTHQSITHLDHSRFNLTGNPSRLNLTVTCIELCCWSRWSGASERASLLKPESPCGTFFPQLSLSLSLLVLRLACAGHCFYCSRCSCSCTATTTTTTTATAWLRLLPAAASSVPIITTCSITRTSTKIATTVHITPPSTVTATMRQLQP